MGGLSSGMRRISASLHHTENVRGHLSSNSVERLGQSLKYTSLTHSVKQ
jgi:hypothetical protein